jgi:hypothetical protein
MLIEYIHSYAPYMEAVLKFQVKEKIITLPPRPTKHDAMKT